MGFRRRIINTGSRKRIPKRHALAFPNSKINEFNFEQSFLDFIQELKNKKMNKNDESSTTSDDSPVN